MLSVKNELLAALAASLETLSAGAGAKAVFESPKVAAHGDLATTAAIQLAKPLQRNPRQLAETLREHAEIMRPLMLRASSDPLVAATGKSYYANNANAVKGALLLLGVAILMGKALVK